MKRQPMFRKMSPIIITLTILIVSCNSAGPKPPVSETNLTDSNKVSLSANPIPVSAATGPLTGYLDTLWIDSLKFTTLKKRMTLRFYIGDEGSFTLHGWSGKYDEYNDKAPDLMLKTGIKSTTVQFGPKSYFGNLVLDHSAIKEIQRVLKQTKTAKFVLFAPQNPATNKGEITYEIFITNDDPLTSDAGLIIQAPTPTGIKTNPSPPRNS